MYIQKKHKIGNGFYGAAIFIAVTVVQHFARILRLIIIVTLIVVKQAALLPTGTLVCINLYLNPRHI